MSWSALLVLVVVGALLWFWLRPKPKSTAATVTLSVSGPSSFRDSGPTVRHEVVPGGWRVGTNLPLPLTLLGIDAADAERLAKATSERNYDAFKEQLVLLIAKKNVRCVEVDDWVADAKAKVDASVQAAIAASKEWASASELDRQDLLLAFRNSAIETLSVRPNVEIASALLEGPPKDVTADDELVAKFSNRPDLYPVLLSAISNGNKVMVVPADGWRRKEFETLAENGYLRRGDAIPLDDALAVLTLKQMQEVAGASAPKKFARKAAAIEFLKTLPDLRARLGKVIAFRELFQLAPTDGLDTIALAQSYRYAGELARVIRKTLFSGVSSLSEAESAKEWSPEGWQLHANECCLECMKMDGKKWKRLPQRLPPFHIGCEAHLSPE